MSRLTVVETLALYSSRLSSRLPNVIPHLENSGPSCNLLVVLFIQEKLKLQQRFYLSGLLPSMWTKRTRTEHEGWKESTPANNAVKDALFRKKDLMIRKR